MQVSHNIKNLIRSDRGISLVELLVSTAAATTVALIFGGALVGFSRWQARAHDRATKLVAAQQAFARIIKYGSLADRCRKIPTPGTSIFSLECWVEFSGGFSVPISFTYDPNAGSLRYVRDDQEVWVLAANEFILCDGTDLKTGGCLGSAGDIPANVPLENYFRLKVSLPYAEGEVFTAQSGFFVKNSNKNDGIKYVMRSNGGA